MNPVQNRRRRMNTLAAQIRACLACEGMNIPTVTQAAPGFGSLSSPVVIIGQSLCGPCMASQIPFTGGSGRVLDRSLQIAGLAKTDIFLTNVVHCHPPGNRPSQPHEIINCRPYLHNELAIVAPRLVVALGKDARAAVTSEYPSGRILSWPFVPPTRDSPVAQQPDLIFAPHPSWIVRQPTPAREEYEQRLADALMWAFDDAP